MIVLLDTSTPITQLSLVEGEWRYDTSWESGRGLAKGILSFLETEIRAQGKKMSDVSGLVVFKGPGSFTGLRIGVTVFNTLAYTNNVPVIGATGNNWQAEGIAALLAGGNDEIVLPEYGGEANITQPRK